MAMTPSDRGGDDDLGEEADDDLGAAGDGCLTRPGLNDRTDRTQIQGCLGPNPVGPIF